LDNGGIYVKDSHVFSSSVFFFFLAIFLFTVLQLVAAAAEIPRSKRDGVRMFYRLFKPLFFLFTGHTLPFDAEYDFRIRKLWIPRACVNIVSRGSVPQRRRSYSHQLMQKTRGFEGSCVYLQASSLLQSQGSHSLLKTQLR
jgi:hypothetical protein